MEGEKKKERGVKLISQLIFDSSHPQKETDAQVNCSLWEAHSEIPESVYSSLKVGGKNSELLSTFLLLLKH